MLTNSPVCVFVRHGLVPNEQVPDLLAVGKAYMVMGDDKKGEQMLKSAWARGGDPFDLAAAQVRQRGPAGGTPSISPRPR
eukprot:5075929-Pyramimonas_sp.AAC.1